MPGRRNRILVTAGFAVVGLVTLLLNGACNDHELMPFSSVVKVQRSDHILNPPKRKFDILWVVDDSHSMCDHQSNLVENLETFLLGSGTGEDHKVGIVDLQGDFNMAVISTDASSKVCVKASDGAPANPLDCMDYPNCFCEEDRDCGQGNVCRAVAGRMRQAPIRSDHITCNRTCETDGDCGGNCLCGIPHVQRCDSDDECQPNQKCLGFSNTVKHCANPCSAERPNCGELGWGGWTESGEKIPMVDRIAQRTFSCQEASVEDGGGMFCMLRRCQVSSDCPGENMACLPASDNNKYCRQFNSAGQGVCPPPTCDCPKDFPAAVNLDDYDLSSDDETIREMETDAVNRQFRCMATVGTEGTRWEKGLEAMQKALSSDMISGDGAPNAGFLRDDAFLTVIFLTDEDDCSDGVGSCTRDSDCPGFENDERRLCLQDPIDGRKYCRFNESKNANLCYWDRGKLRPARDFIKFLREIKDNPSAAEIERGATCSSDEECNAQNGEYCSDRHHICAKSRVIVAGIMAPKQNDCVPDVQSCETTTISCEEDLYCSIECNNPDFPVCIDKISIEPQAPVPSCTSEVGVGFNSSRYHALVNSFQWAVSDDICKGQFTGALQRIAQVIEQADKPVYSLNRPLLQCRVDEDCGEGTCLLHDAQEQPLPPYCGDENGRPTDMKVRIVPLDEDGNALRDEQWEVSTDHWRFLRSWLPYGAIEFTPGYGPKPGEVVELSYRAGID